MQIKKINAKKMLLKNQHSTCVLILETLCHICFSCLCLLHNMSSSSVKWLVHYDGQIIKTDEGDTFQSPNPLFFETRQGLKCETLKTKIHQHLRLQPLDQVCNILL